MKVIIQEKARKVLENKLEPGQFLRVSVGHGPIQKAMEHSKTT